MATTFYKPLSCFEPSFERFATVSQDGRLKIFDTRSGGVQQQLAEKDHLSTQYTAIAWGATTFQGVGQTERSKRAKKQLGGAVAIGTAKGTIVVWDVLRGEVHKELGGKEGHTGKVNDLVFTEGATFLFSCSDDLQVIKWNVENGEIVAKFKADNQPISSLALSADNSTLATASAMIKMWDLASSKSQKKFTGHTSAVTSLNFSANGKFLVSASATERYTSVWDLEAAGNAGAAAVFTATSNPVYVEFSKPKKAKAKTSLVLALLRSGSVGLWQFDRKADADAKPTSHKPDSVIKIVLGGETDSKRKKGKAGSVLFAQFTNEHEVLVAFGTTTKPIFERVSLLDEVTGQLKKKITIRDATEAGGALIEAEAPRDKKPNVHSNLIGPTQVNSLVKAGVATEAKKPEPAAAKKEATKAAAAKPKETLTLQEQLDRMQLTVAEEPDEEKEADNDEEKMEAQLSGALEKEVKGLLSVWGGEDKKHHKLKSHQVAPKATSLASALAQAIHTKDRHLLEKVLNIGQEQIIFGTVARLQQDHVLPFLQLVLARFRGNPNRSVNLLVWIRAVFVEHVAYLSTVPALLTSLSDLYSTVRTRLANHKRYVKLAGRLELLNAQIQERNERAEQSQGGVCFYHEDDDKGLKGDDEEGGVSLMDVMDMGDEDEQDMMDDEDDEEDEDDEIEEDGLVEEEDDDNENGDEPSGDEAGGEVDFDDDDEAASDDGEGEDDDDDEEEDDEDN